MRHHEDDGKFEHVRRTVANKRAMKVEFCKFFLPPFRRLVNPCPLGVAALAPCANRIRSVERGVELYEEVVFKDVTRPAQNK